MHFVVLAYLLFYIIPAIILDILQIGYIKSHSTKKPVILNASDYITAASYAITQRKIALIEHLYSFIMLIFWLKFGIIYLNEFCNTQLQIINSFITDWLILLCFFAIQSLLHLPFSILHKYIDSKYGFNKQNVRGFLLDSVKMACIGGILLGIVFAILLFVMNTISLWWIAGFVVMLSFIILMQFIYPTFIMPMFNKITPLQDESLKQRIDLLMEKSGFKNNGIFVMDASKRDGRLNAYFSGLGSSKRVVLFDTLLNKISQDGLIAILGHELGHFKHGDIIKNIIISGCVLFSIFAIMGLFFESLCLYLELPLKNSSILILATLLLPVLTFLFMPIQSYFSRKAEYRADAFGASFVSEKKLSEALICLVNENKTFPYSHPAFIFFYYSHPPLLERLRALGGFNDGD